MRAALAHHGRRLLVSQRRAPSRCAYTSLARRRPVVLPATLSSSHRTFFAALFEPPPREVRRPDHEPGWPQIVSWKNRMMDQVRLPKRKDLIEAWKKFMQSKLKTRIPLNSTQALQCRRVLEYLSETSNSDQPMSPLHLADVAMARQVLLQIEPDERTQNHLDFARAIDKVLSSEPYKDKVRSSHLQWGAFVRALSIYGASEEAMQMLIAKWDEPSYAALYGNPDGLIHEVMCGLAREGREEQLLALVESAEARALPFDSSMHSTMVVFYAQRDRVAETKQWLARPVSQRRTEPEVYQAVASFAARNQLQDWASDFFVSLLHNQPSKRQWDLLLRALLVVGKDVGEIDALVSQVVIRGETPSPNVETINSLLRAALELRSSSLAGAILDYGNERGLASNDETDLIILQLLLQIRDLERAGDVYERVKYSEVWRNGDSRLFGEYRQMLNDYLVILSQEAKVDFKSIMLVLEAIEEYQIVLRPDTVAALVQSFMRADRHLDAMDMLSGHSFFFSIEQREILQSCLMTFCLDPKTSTSRAWAGYQIINQYFPDLNFERRERLMEEFMFQRKRPDMATQVFGNMRQHQNMEFHPRLSTYIRYFQGLALYPEPKVLTVVHNMLKTDTTLQPNTMLYTAMMLAYTSCDRTDRALEFWTEITRSREGPSLASLEAVFWALENRPGGCERAKGIWERLMKLDLDVPRGVFNAYAGAVASGGNLDDLQQLLASMASIVGTGPDHTTLGIAHNALRGQQLQHDFCEWAEKNYPDSLTQLRRSGCRQDEFRLRYFKVKRDMRV